MIEVQPKKSSLWDERAVIRYAAQKAVATGRAHYVVAENGKWVCQANQPSFRWSHWKVDHMAELFAHMGGPEVREYHYEQAK